MSSFVERAVEVATRFVSARTLSRRSFLTRSAVLGSALAVDPFGYILRPGTAYATVCGSGNECTSGWTAFCATITEGANVCPPGSYAAGWWKVDDSAFCRGAARYYVDCNRHPDHTCECRCADGECDRRKVCCNTFRYGQCNQQVPGITEVVCRVILCTPPWEWDASCTTTPRTDPATATHSTTYLPGEWATDIEIKYQDLGLLGSVLGAQTRAERAVGDGTQSDYQLGVIVWRADRGAHHVHGPVHTRYADLGGAAGALGFPVRDQEPVRDGAAGHFEFGSIWSSPTHGTFVTSGPIQTHYVTAEGGAAGRLGFPISEVITAEAGWIRVDFENGHSIVHDDERGTKTVLTSDLPEDGSWPEDAPVPDSIVRLAGDSRTTTAIAISVHAFPEGAGVAFVARADDFSDALGGGVLAARAGGPVLLTPTDRLDHATADEIQRLAPKRIILLGGPSAVGPAVAEALRAETGIEPERLQGPDRYATAATIARATYSVDPPKRILLANGGTFPDALAGVPVAASTGSSLLLTGRDDVPQSTLDEVDRSRPDEIVLLGGANVISDRVARRLARHTKVVSRMAGTSRWDTAAAISRSAFSSADTVVIANGMRFPDALAAGVLAGRVPCPVLLVDAHDLPQATADELARLRPTTIVIAGGRSAVSDEVARRLAAYTSAT